MEKANQAAAWKKKKQEDIDAAKLLAELEQCEAPAPTSGTLTGVFHGEQKVTGGNW